MTTRFRWRLREGENRLIASVRAKEDTMDDDIITMDDMARVYEVTDELGLDREEINVELGKEDPGGWHKSSGGMMKREVIEITLPQSEPLEQWLPKLKAGLAELTRDQ